MSLSKIKFSLINVISSDVTSLSNVIYLIINAREISTFFLDKFQEYVKGEYIKICMIR